MDHYFAPAVGWTIAVSRRFHGERAVLLYERAILPVLRQHGVVMECSYASDDRQSSDYWVRRINVILEVADIHILLDLDRSGYVEYEFDVSQRLAIRARAGTTALLLKWAPEGAIAVLRPKRILITDRQGHDTYSRRKRTLTLGIDGTPVDALQARLGRAILDVKARRTRYLRRGMSLLSLLPQRLRESQATPLSVAEDAYRIALALAAGHRVSELEDSLHPTDRRVHHEHRLQAVVAEIGNEFTDFHLARRTGRAAVPERFRDRYVFMRTFYTKELQKLVSDEAQKTRTFRAIITFLAFAGAFSRIGAQRVLGATAPDDPTFAG